MGKPRPWLGCYSQKTKICKIKPETPDRRFGLGIFAVKRIASLGKQTAG
jgi:hypothetical protein